MTYEESQIGLLTYKNICLSMRPKDLYPGRMAECAADIEAFRQLRDQLLFAGLFARFVFPDKYEISIEAPALLRDGKAKLRIDITKGDYVCWIMPPPRFICSTNDVETAVFFVGRCLGGG